MVSFIYLSFVLFPVPQHAVVNHRSDHSRIQTHRMKGFNRDQMVEAIVCGQGKEGFNIVVHDTVEQNVAEAANKCADKDDWPWDWRLSRRCDLEHPQPELRQVLATEGREDGQQSGTDVSVGKAVQMAFACDEHDQRLNIHHDLCPAKDHQAKAALQQRFDQDSRAHMDGYKRHGFVLVGVDTAMVSAWLYTTVTGVISR